MGGFMAKKRIIESESVKAVAERLFDERKIDRPRVAKIAYFLVSPNISKKTHATCSLADKLLQYYANVDYVIQIGEESWNLLNEKGKEILVLHELNHILEYQNQETGEWHLKLRPHDVQDFAHVIRNYGMDWFYTHENLENMRGEVKPEVSSESTQMDLLDFGKSLEKTSDQDLIESVFVETSETLQEDYSTEVSRTKSFEYEGSVVAELNELTDTDNEFSFSTKVLEEIESGKRTELTDRPF